MATTGNNNAVHSWHVNTPHTFSRHLSVSFTQSRAGCIVFV